MTSSLTCLAWVRSDPVDEKTAWRLAADVNLSLDSRSQARAQVTFERLVNSSERTAELAHLLRQLRGHAI